MYDGKENNPLVKEAIKQGAVPDGYKEVKAEFFQFKKEGDTLAGRFIKRARTRVRGNEVGKYVVLNEKQERVTFLGGVHLDDLLEGVPVGSEVWIQFLYAEKNEDTGNEMKRFKVLAKNPGS